jgi:uncharacterized phosphosugar-binding protein
MINEYFDALIAQIEEIRREESDTLRRAAEATAKSLASGGVIHLFDTGHMITQEFNQRAGGLVAFTPFSFNMNVQSHNMREDRQIDGRIDSEVIALALKRSSIRPGDVLIVGSVSGRAYITVEVAIQAREMGVYVIGVTGVQQASVAESEHPSGKLLYQVADIVIDTHVVAGDALMAIPGMERKVGPSSGISAAAALWAMTVEMCAILAAEGNPPTVYMSANLPGGMDELPRTKELYKQRKI